MRTRIKDFMFVLLRFIVLLLWNVVKAKLLYAMFPGCRASGEGNGIHIFCCESEAFIAKKRYQAVSSQ
jgi:hypothetical protein